MSVSALTTAMAVAAAAVPNEAPPSVDTVGSEPIAVGHDPAESGLAPEAEISPPLVLGQSTPPSQSNPPGQSTEPSEAVQSTDPASSVQPTAPPPVDGQTDIVVTGRKPSPDDPLEDINSTSFGVAQDVDESIVAPIAFAYEDIMPRPIRKGLSNFLHNLGEPIVFLNFMLQLKPGKAAETLGRFAINTTLGAGGLVDIAKRKPFNLPYRHNGFANTLGYYGVKPGPYFYLPLVGPTTLRDFIGDRLDLFILPAIVGNKFSDPKIVTPIWVLKELGRRIEIDDELRETQATRDPYVAARTHYLQKRQAEIEALHGRGASSVKPPVPGPADNRGSSGTAGGVDPQPLDTGDLLFGPSIFGTGGYTRLTGDFVGSPLVSLRCNASQWPGALGLACSW